MHPYWYKLYLAERTRNGRTSGTAIHQSRPVSNRGAFGGTHPAYRRNK